jgi:uncharacterized membrane protein
MQSNRENASTGVSRAAVPLSNQANAPDSVHEHGAHDGDQHPPATTTTQPSGEDVHSRHAADADPDTSGHDHAHGPVGIRVVAAIGRHPLHPMLVPLPIGLFVAALIGDLGFWFTGNAEWAKISTWLLAAGLAAGIVASAAGLTDFVGNSAIRALYHARYHLVGNLTLLAIAAASLVFRVVLGPAQAILPWGLFASVAVVGLLVFTGWHGGEMVFGHGVGMQPHEHGANRGVRKHAAHL